MGRPTKGYMYTYRESLGTIRKYGYNIIKNIDKIINL